MTSTSTTPNATGHREVHDGVSYVVLTRTFRAPIEDVWAAITEPHRLARWIGTWEGDPSDGHVKFQMTYESDGTQPERFQIEECEQPHLLRITTTSPYAGGDGAESWLLRLDLREDAGITTLRFAQNVPDPAMAEGVGPGWEYYLDRMVAAESGQDVEAIDFDDYYPALSAHYRSEFA